MLYSVTSDRPDLFFYAIFDENSGEVALDAVSVSSTEIVLVNESNGAILTLEGTGLSLAPNGSAASGTVTSYTLTEADLTPVGSITDISWGLVAFDTVIGELEVQDFTGLAALINADAPVTIDISNATGPMDVESALEGIAELITVGFTFFDSAFETDMKGSVGEDTFNLRGPSDDFSFINIEASEGDDTFNLGDANEGLFVNIDYDQDYSQTVFAIDLELDAIDDFAVVTYGTFTDTINDVAHMLTQTDGLGITGSREDDYFDATLGEDASLYLSGGEGVDEYDFNLLEGAFLRLSFLFGASDDPTQGIDVNIGTGTINDDGFGNTETLTAVVDPGARLEIRATDFADFLVGSNGRDSFITEQGNDTVDGGDGFDRVRYDRSGVDAVTVDLETGTATGTWDGNFFEDTLINIESIRGSREGDDMLSGSAEDEDFEGRGGNDTISTGAGDDLAEGDDGEDEISMGLGEDTAFGGDGDDLIRGNSGEDMLFGDEGNDQLRGQKNGDYLDGGEGNDNLKGGGGNDTLIGGEGDDFLNGGSRADSIEGGAGRDNLIGRSFNDTLVGGEGADRLNGGGDDDLLEGAEGNDFIKGGAGNDTFRFFQGWDSDRLIGVDFSEDIFQIDFTVVEGLTAQEVENLVVQDGNDMVLDVSGDGFTNVIRFVGLTSVDGFAESIVFI